MFAARNISLVSAILLPCIFRLEGHTSLTHSEVGEGGGRGREEKGGEEKAVEGRRRGGEKGGEGEGGGGEGVNG